METALGMLMAAGIFVAGPALIGFAILGTVILRERRYIARAQKYQAAAAATAPKQEHRLVGAGPRKTE